jgi:GNAT superfamily N-acetyltransferase
MESTMTPKAAKFLNSSIRFRDANQADVAFIFNSWLKSNRSSALVQGVSNPVYFAQHHLLIEGLVKTCKVIVAVNADDTSQIFGYIVYDVVEGMPVIHYVYVKQPYRKLGLAALMLEQAQIDGTKPFFTTHKPDFRHRMIERKFTIILNPYLAYYAYAVGRGLAADALADKWAPNPTTEARLKANLMEQVNGVKASIGGDGHE